MPDEVHGFEEKGDENPWCVQCANFLKWPYHDECLGCLSVGGRPAETVSFRAVHWDVAVLHAVIRRKVAVWEQRHPGWELVPDMQRYWEDSTHPSKYVDRETGIGRKLAWTRFRVERKHPRGARQPLWGYTLTIRAGSALLTIRAGSALRQAVLDPASVRRNLEAVGLLRPPPAGVEVYRFDRDALVQGVRQLAEPGEREVESPSALAEPTAPAAEEERPV